MKQHMNVLDTRWFGLYLNGNYCIIELEVFNLVIQLFTKNGLINCFIVR